MKYRSASVFYIIENKEHRLGKFISGLTPDSVYEFISSDEKEYPNRAFLIREVKLAYRTLVNVNVKGFDLIVKEVTPSEITVLIEPGNPAIKVFNAQIIEGGGWYQSLILRSEVDKIWEERYTVDNYLFPEYLDFIEEVEL